MSASKKRQFSLFLMIVLVVSLVLAWGKMDVAYQRNRLAIQVSRGLLGGAPLPESKQYAFLGDDCRTSWFLGQLADKENSCPKLNPHWRYMVQCLPDRAEFLYAYYSEDLGFARQVNLAQPGSAIGWFWLGELSRDEDPQKAIQFYRRGLALDPTNSFRWRQLGDALSEAMDLPSALQAYSMACQTGDTGGLGCLRSGITAEMMGDYSTALYYYHRSHSPKIQRYIERLENLIEQQP